MDVSGINRRELIRGSIGMLVAAQLTARAEASDDAPAGLIVRKPDPLNAETPLARLDSYLTPVDRFFIRSHHPNPPARPDAPLEVGGMVRQSRTWTPSEIRKLEPVTLPALLQCSGNGRTRYNPLPGGVGWEQGAVGNAEWTGVRLKDLLELAGLADGVKHVHFRGRDEPPKAGDPVFLRSLPIERALDPSTLVAFAMNGEDLPAAHGGPLRLVVPGWVGNHWMKWLRSITPAADEAPGSFQRVDYRMPQGTDTAPITTLNVKSLFTSLAPKNEIRAGATTIEGVAWTGAGRVSKMEIAIDDGPWQAAELFGPDHEGAWRRWRFAWDAKPGAYRIRARATDSQGAVQPDAPPWNKGGYLWNGIEAVTVKVL